MHGADVFLCSVSNKTFLLYNVSLSEFGWSLPMLHLHGKTERCSALSTLLETLLLRLYSSMSHLIPWTMFLVEHISSQVVLVICGWSMYIPLSNFNWISWRWLERIQWNIIRNSHDLAQLCSIYLVALEWIHVQWMRWKLNFNELGGRHFLLHSSY